MNRLSPLLFCVLLIACSPLSGGGKTMSSSSSSLRSSDVIVDSPLADAIVTSPLTVTGKARGTWYFEASFPVRLLDDEGNELAVVPAQAQSDWMTKEYVEFSAVLTFTTTAKTGTLVLQKDNPSGMPEYDRSVSLPVKFP